MDPFVDLIRLLQPCATRWRRIEASGRWAVSFPKRNDLLFASVLKGECLLLRPAQRPLPIAAGDFVLIRTNLPFSFASDSRTTPQDSEKAFAKLEKQVIKVGKGKQRPVTLVGGRFLFETANENLLTSLLPSLVHISAKHKPIRRIQSLLRMNAAESLYPKPGSDFVIPRLMELLLIEILRDRRLHEEAPAAGLLQGLADPVVAPALQAIHGNIAGDWTVAKLAKIAGVSRSAFALRFRSSLGTGPIEYLQDWRMAVAKNELRQGRKSISEIAFAIGFQSASAFSTAFSKRIGCSPRHFTASSASGS